MTFRLVVEIYRMRLRVELFRFGHKVLDSLDMWEGLETEFTIEAPTNLIVDLILFLRTVPHCRSR